VSESTARDGGQTPPTVAGSDGTDGGMEVGEPKPRHDRPVPGILGELRYWLYFFSWILARSVFYVLFGLRLRGTSNVPKEGGLVIASNHQSFLDPIIVGIALGPWRQMHYMARDTLFVGPFGWLIRAYNAFPIRRGRADRGALAEAEKRVGWGLPLLVFPEGTRSVDGKLQRVKAGAARLALNTGAAVVPCYIHGAHRAWGKGRKFFRPIRGMRVFLGEPIESRNFKADRKGREELRVEMAKALARLEELAYSGS